VDLALGFFREQSLFRDYSESEQKDIKTFLGSYSKGLEEAKALLFSIADADRIEQACAHAEVGWQDQKDFYFHRDVLPDLEPVLRVYVGCAAELLGDTGEVDIIKIHMRTGKVTFLRYQDFEDAAFPELHERVKVDLRHQRVGAFDHHDAERQQVLYFRSRFVSPDHPLLPKWQRHEARARKLGLDDRELMGPWKHELEGLLETRGLTPWLVAMRPHGGRSSAECSP
jgi:DNA phosphorothioation-associated putative methyltransferase